MSIRLIAKELYRLQREVERLEASLGSAPDADRDRLQDELRRIRAERNRMKKILEGSKVPPEYRRPK